MDVPPEIAFRNVEPTDELKQKVLDGIEKLEKVYPNLASCRVMIEKTDPAAAGRPGTGKPHVRIDLRVPNKELVVKHDAPARSSGHDLSQWIEGAFDVARRRLRDLKGRQSDRLDHQELPPHGRVVRLLTDANGVNYGFLHSRDGREIYFHENALVDLDYDDLEVGTEVRFAESRGDEGPQASTVAPLDRDKIGPRQEEDVPLQ